MGYVINNASDVLSIEAINENNSTNAIDTPEPEWDIEIKDYPHEDTFSENGFKVALFKPIAMCFEITDCISDFWLARNCFTKQHKCRKCFST